MKSIFAIILLLSFFFSSCLIITIRRRTDGYNQKLYFTSKERVYPKLKTDGFYRLQFDSVYQFPPGDSYPTEYNEEFATKYKLSPDFKYNFGGRCMMFFDSSKNLAYTIMLDDHIYYKIPLRLILNKNLGKKIKSDSVFHNDSVNKEILLLFPEFLNNDFDLNRNYSPKEIKEINEINLSRKFSFRQEISTLGYSVYEVKNDTLSIQYYIDNDEYETNFFDFYAFFPIPIVVKDDRLTTIRLKIKDDSTLHLLQVSRIFRKGKHVIKDFSDKNIYFKYYPYSVNERINFSKSFFNTNKSYLRYSKRMRKKEEKLKAKQRYKEVK